MELLSAIFVIATCFACWGYRKYSPGESPRGPTIVFDETTVSVRYGDGEIRTVRWCDLTRITIRTTDQGPFLDDVLWALYAADEDMPALVYPQGSPGERELLEKMQHRLANFDNMELVHAMGSTENAYFLVWQGEPAAAREFA